VGDAAPDLQLVDHAGKHRRLSRLVRRAPALLLFFSGPEELRGRALLRDYRDLTLALRQAGVRPFGVGHAEPSAVAFLRAQTGISFPLLADPEGAQLSLFGMDRRVGVFLLDRELHVLRRARDGREAAEATIRFLRRGGAKHPHPSFGERVASFFRGQRPLPR
jgi:peroxiredoxin Q/BCP